MTKNYFKVLFFIMISIMLVSGCVTKKPQNTGTYDAGGSGSYDTAGSGSYNAGESAQKAGQSPESFILDPEKLEMGEYMEKYVNTFLVILDASGSKYLPYNGQVKLKIAKDIVRRLNQKTPPRPLTGALRRYGFQAGAFSKPTALLYDVGPYSRPAYAGAIEIVRWAGGKSPLALSIDEASDDFAPTTGLLSLVVISDGKIYQGDAVEAAKRIKARYGDRICIYTCLVGNLPFGRDLLERVAKAGKCGYAITADDLIGEKPMEDWAYDIFHRGHKIKQPKRAKKEFIKRPDPLDSALRLKVQFDLNKWDIRSEYYEGLNNIARFMSMRKYSSVKVEIQGHTCNIWTEKYNMKLSHLRATEVMKYLINKGVRPEQLFIEGLGLKIPTASNKTERGRVANRRAEFRRAGFTR
ncbi:OmpA family protein [Desulfococcaceae bacterium HSG8]|nr:OmpA family protein [Desulfococcaceae bacterium HSG8]